MSSVQGIDRTADEEDDDAPPQLEREEGPSSEEVLMQESIERGQVVSCTSLLCF